MAQETNILLQVSDDGNTWTDLVLLDTGVVQYTHDGLSFGDTKYYRTIAKGDGINTLDSAPSSPVSITTGFVTEYQNILDYATANSIGTPSLTQNIINDNIVRNFLRIGKWDSFDVLYYFQQEVGTPYEFMTLNWIDPTKHRLTNGGANPVDFVGGSGFKVLGSNNQYFNMNFIPSIDAVKATKTSAGVFFSIFDAPTVYSNVLRVAGSIGDSLEQLNILQSESDAFLTRVFHGGGLLLPITQSQINAHYQISKVSAVSTRFINGELADSVASNNTGGISDVATVLFGSYTTSAFPSEAGFGMKYFALGSHVAYSNKDIYKILNNTFVYEEPAPTGVSRFTATASALPTLYFIQVFRADKFPNGTFLGASKKYIVLYSTDHGGGGSTGVANGAIAWGEADHPNLIGFVEKGIIMTGYQAETPHLEYVPNDPDGHILHLYWHPVDTHPDSGGFQQTRLWTAPSGILLDDTAAWTDRGKPLGITQFETDNYGSSIHTGYLVVFPQQDGTFKGIHSVKENLGPTEANVPKIGISSASATGRDWSRTIQEVDVTSFMTFYRQFHHTRSIYFTRNTIQYLLGCSTRYDFDWTDTKIGIAQCDGNFQPVTYLGDISGEGSGNGCTNASFFIEGDTLHIYYTMGATELFYTTWDLKNLD